MSSPSSVAGPATPQPTPDLADPAEGDLRLVTRRDVNGYTVGALQIFVDGAFGAVCGASLRSTDAGVACRQLGFVGGGRVVLAQQVLSDAELQEADVPPVLENPACVGTEERLADCPAVGEALSPYYYSGFYGVGPKVCDPDVYDDRVEAFVACGSLEGPGLVNGDLRLVGGATSEDGLSQYGRLEVFYEGGWGSVCSRFDFPLPFTRADAQVACRSLGFAEGIAIKPRDVDDDSVFLLPTWRLGASCVGDEASLLDCPDGPIDVGVNGLAPETFCFVVDTIELSCTLGSDPDLDGRLRLVDGGTGPGYEYGRLEIFVRGFWSTVCDKRGFTPNAARVACRSLGFDGGAVIRFDFFLGAEVLVAGIPPGISAVDCDGSESSLLECTSSNEYEIQSGCSVDGSTANDATVLACVTPSTDCEAEIAPEQGAVRLRGGFGTPCDPLYSGIVEVFNAGEWGALCEGGRGKNRDFLVVDVVCRQLGFPHGGTVDGDTTRPDLNDRFYLNRDVSEEAAEDDPPGRFWLDMVTCAGQEQRLLDCNLGGGFIPESAADRPCSRFATTVGEPSRLHVACRQFAIPEALEDVVTPGAEEGDLRLVGLTEVDNWRVGRLELFFDGSWGQVCGGRFSAPDAAVACRQLGYAAAGTQAVNLVPIDEPNTAISVPKPVLTFPGCAGSEPSLLDCPSEDSSDDTLVECLGSPASISPDLVLACVAAVEDGQEGALRLAEREQRGRFTVGILEIFHAGAWGTLCRDRDISFFSAQRLEGTASIACRELGLPARGRFETVPAPATPARPPPWLQTPWCQGTEATLSACKASEFGDGPLEFGDVEDCKLYLRLVCRPPVSSKESVDTEVG